MTYPGVTSRCPRTQTRANQWEDGSSVHMQLLSAIRHRILAHEILAPLWSAWPGSSGLSLTFLESRPWASAMFNGERHTLELRLATKSNPESPFAEKINLLINQFDEVEIPLKGHALIDFHFVKARTEAAKNEGTECLIAFEALTLADPPVEHGVLAA
jgi:hypothetical protein